MIAVETEVSKILRLSADYIEARGWCQNFLEEWDGSVCAFGALVNVCKDLDLGGDMFVLAEERLWETINAGNPRWVVIQDWNDAVGRTKEEVVAAFRLAAAQ